MKRRTRFGTDGARSVPRGKFSLEGQRPAAKDWLRIAELVALYRDLPLGTVEASVVATAERLGVEDIPTVDRRHFRTVRPSRAAAFHAAALTYATA